jgi:hypothetical protein
VCTPTIKSSGTQFYKPVLASETLRSRRSGPPGYTTFRCGHFGRLWSSNGVRMTRLRPFYGYNLNGFSTGADRESSFQGKLIAPGSHLSPLGMTYILRVNDKSVEELLCTFLSKNNACSFPNMRLVAGWVIEHAKLHFGGFWCTKEPPPSIQTNM